MIHDLTYSNRQANIEINKAIGKPFGFFSKERWRGIGSQRYVIKLAEGKLADIFEGNYSQNFANIELRPNGILLRIRYRLEVYGVTFPFGQLSIFKTDPTYFTLFAGSEKVRLEHYQGWTFDQKFLNKILAAKATYYEEHHAN